MFDVNLWEAAFLGTAVFTLICMAVELNLVKKTKIQMAVPTAYRNLRVKYLVVFFLAFLADWLQGAHIFALYASYGYSDQQIATLFVVGFASSGILGTFVGGLGDQFGRKRLALCYCLIYISSCATKHFNNLWLLLLGRVLGGISTSLLFTIFEAWFVTEHRKYIISTSLSSTSQIDDQKIVRNYDEHILFSEQNQNLLSGTFSIAQFGNSLVAIMAGQIAQMSTTFRPLTPSLTPADAAGQGNGLQFYYGLYITPFDLSALVLLMCLIMILSLWEENGGRDDLQFQPDHPSDSNHLSQAVPSTNPLDIPLLTRINNKSNTKHLNKIILQIRYIFQNQTYYLCGLTMCCFESSMYIFVFLWTPTLTASTHQESPGRCNELNDSSPPPYGLIFSTFMLSAGSGAMVFHIMMSKWQLNLFQKSAIIFFIGTIALTTPIWTNNLTLCLVAFIIFEFTVGYYWPVMSTLKGHLISDKNRAISYNIFRFPINFIVSIVLLLNIEQQTIQFTICSGLTLISTISMFLLGRNTTFNE